MKLPEPPRHLSARSRDLWRRIISTYVFGDHDVELLRVGLEALDRCDEARTIIKKDGGPVVHNRWNMPVKHPAVAIEETARIQFVRVMRELALEGELPSDTRPPRPRGRYQGRP
jgi:P27 family predicted phage terminase small subunit